MRHNRYNPRITLDQYLHLLDLKRHRKSTSRGAFQQLVKEWGIPQSTLSTAVCRGIKAYDYVLWKQGFDLPSSR